MNEPNPASDAKSQENYNTLSLQCLEDGCKGRLRYKTRYNDCESLWAFCSDCSQVHKIDPCSNKKNFNISKADDKIYPPFK